MLFKMLGKQRFGILDAVLGIRPKCTENSHAVGIAATEKRGTRGGTNRLGNMKIGQLDTIKGQTVDVGCADLLCTKTTQVCITKVIRKDQYDVRRPFRTMCRKHATANPQRQTAKDDVFHGMMIPRKASSHKLDWTVCAVR